MNTVFVYVVIEEYNMFGASPAVKTNVRNVGK
jgi:hypothetical protein